MKSFLLLLLTLSSFAPIEGRSVRGGRRLVKGDEQEQDRELYFTHSSKGSSKGSSKAPRPPYPQHPPPPPAPAPAPGPIIFSRAACVCRPKVVGPLSVAFPPFCTDKFAFLEGFNTCSSAPCSEWSPPIGCPSGTRCINNQCGF